MRSSWPVVFAVILLVGSFAGVVRGVRIALAQVLYHDAKYGRAANDPQQVLKLCSTAQRLYPYNYYFHIWAAESAYRAHRETESIPARTELLQAARDWCDIGLNYNPYRSELRTLKMRLLEMESLEEAIRYWQAYLEWHFWEPYNHAVMVELYAKAGDLERALAEMKWVRGTRHYEHAKRTLEEAWSRERQLPGPLRQP